MWVICISAYNPAEVHSDCICIRQHELFRLLTTTAHHSIHELMRTHQTISAAVRSKEMRDRQW